MEFDLQNRQRLLARHPYDRGKRFADPARGSEKDIVVEHRGDQIRQGSEIAQTLAGQRLPSAIDVGNDEEAQLSVLLSRLSGSHALRRQIC